REGRGPTRCAHARRRPRACRRARRTRGDPGMSVAPLATRSVRRRPAQALLIGVAVVIATAFAATALTLALNARVALVDFGMSTPEGVDVAVTPPGDVASAEFQDIADDIRALPGVEEVVVEYLGDVDVEIGDTTVAWKLGSD